MTNLKAFFVALIAVTFLTFASSNAAFAGNGNKYKKKASTAPSISQQIQNRIGSPTIDLKGGIDTEAIVTFAIDNEGQLIVLGVSNEHTTVIDYLTKKLNRSQLAVNPKAIGQTYHIKLQFEVD